MTPPPPAQTETAPPMSTYRRARAGWLDHRTFQATWVLSIPAVAKTAVHVLWHGPTLFDAAFLLLGVAFIARGAQRMTMEKFHHSTAAGDITLPHFKNLPFGTIRRLRKADEAEQMFQLVEEVADEDTLAVLDQLGMSDIEGVFTAWQQASGVTAGESSASSDS